MLDYSNIETLSSFIWQNSENPASMHVAVGERATRRWMARLHSDQTTSEAAGGDDRRQWLTDARSSENSLRRIADFGDQDATGSTK